MPSFSLPITSAVATALFLTPAFAQDSRFSAEFSAEIETDFTFDSDDTAGEITDTFLTIEGALSYSLTDRVSLNSTLLIEPVSDVTGDRFLEDHGLFAEELFFSAELGAVDLTLGKFNPTFGVAWDAAPGIYGVDFAEDYEITERVGAALSFGFEFGGGDHELQIAAFQADRSILSDALLEGRDRLRLADGGVSNTAGIESVSVALSGSFGNTDYNLGLQSQGAGVGNADDQNGAVFGVSHSIESATPIELLGEIAYFDSFNGTSESATIATLGVAAEFDLFTLSGVFALRDIDGAPTDSLFTFSAERALSNDVTASIGYRFGDEDDVESNTLGLLLAYEF